MMKKKRMIASLLVFVVSGTILLGADIPFAERDPDKFPSQSLVNFALREVHDGFIHPKQGRDNWTLFIPLLERVAKYRGSVGKEDVASVEARIVSWFTLYAFACEYDSDPVKAEFGGRLDCLRRIGEFDLIIEAAIKCSDSFLVGRFIPNAPRRLGEKPPYHRSHNISLPEQ